MIRQFNANPSQPFEIGPKALKTAVCETSATFQDEFRGNGYCGTNSVKLDSTPRNVDLLMELPVYN
jgi:hypothetical protein